MLSSGVTEALKSSQPKQQKFVPMGYFIMLAFLFAKKLCEAVLRPPRPVCLRATAFSPP